MDAERTGGFAPAVAETHSGVVFFYGDRAYKAKKPVDLGFLDFRTREARRAVCHREVALNRRLAPDVYLGVADLVGPDGELSDHLVVMRRMPIERRLSELVRAGADVTAHLDELADLLVAFHRRADRGAAVDAEAGVDATAGRWAHNTAEMEAFAGRFLDATAIEEVDGLAQRYLAGRRPLFERRVAERRACDGHGDLLTDDIFCLDDGPRVLDCLEFDDRLRYGDVLADVAFLAMDLERLGRPDLAQRFLDRYREVSGDRWPRSLAHHHVAYRAQVRAKVSAIRADQGADGAAEEAVALLDLAREHLRAGAVRLVLVGGLPGTGKSTLAAELGGQLGAVVLRTDVIRKELAGLEPTAPAAAAFGEGLYGADAKAATYAALLERAEALLVMGETVVLDASWSRAEERGEARRLAEQTASDLVELVCVAPPEVTADRMDRRRRRGGDASDADPAVAAALAAQADPWPEAHVVDTAGSLGRSVAAARTAIGV